MFVLFFRGKVNEEVCRKKNKDIDQTEGQGVGEEEVIAEVTLQLFPDLKTSERVEIKMF